VTVLDPSGGLLASVALLAWGVFWVVWLVAAAGASRPVETEAPLGRLAHLGLFAVAFVLLFTDAFAGTVLFYRIFAPSVETRAAGLVLELAGLAFALVARFFLGRNWSGTVTIKENHQLIRRGPYRFVRHPIYTGILFGVVGTGVLVAEWRSIAAVVAILLAYAVKIPREEAFMKKAFGAQYEEYRRRVKALIPFVW
jgi:protein-S-isoprenylcysteine O-methyltransferase Ste14